MVKKKSVPASDPPKNLGGRPPLFETYKELQDKIDDYFENGVTRRKVIVGKGEKKQVVELPIITITGLCLHLGFESRQSFYDLEKNSKFSYTIKRARLLIENDYEEELRVGNTIAAIFALKQFSWSDKQEIKHSGDKEQPLFPENKMSSDKIKKLVNDKIKKLKKLKK